MHFDKVCVRGSSIQVGESLVLELIVKQKDNKLAAEYSVLKSGQFMMHPPAPIWMQLQSSVSYEDR